MTWTKFFDMRSGGREKEEYQYIYIEAKEKEAKVIFYNIYGHNPERVTCTCCGEDYSITEYKTLGKATEYYRKNNVKKIITIKEFEKSGEVKIWRKKDIKPEWRLGDISRQGYVWVD